MDTMPSPVVEESGESVTLGKFAEALSKAQGAMTVARKDSMNPHFKTRYADLSSVWEACREPLSANGLAVIQRVTASRPGVVTLKTMVIHASGEYIWDKCSFPVAQATPQGYGSALTYLRRYTFSAAVGVAAGDEDDDGGAASTQPRQPEQPKQPSPDVAAQAAAAAEARARVEEERLAQARRARVKRVWDRAQRLGMDLGAFRTWVENTLEVFKESKDWTDEDIGALEERLSALETSGGITT
jgi:hypothetical protein